MKKKLIRALCILRWITFAVFFLASTLFLVYCVVHSDCRLSPAIFCVLVTSAMLAKEIWLRKRFGQ